MNFTKIESKLEMTMANDFVYGLPQKCKDLIDRDGEFDDASSKIV